MNRFTFFTTLSCLFAGLTGMLPLDAAETERIASRSPTPGGISARTEARQRSPAGGYPRRPHCAMVCIADSGIRDRVSECAETAAPPSFSRGKAAEHRVTRTRPEGADVATHSTAQSRGCSLDAECLIDLIHRRHGAAPGTFSTLRAVLWLRLPRADLRRRRRRRSTSPRGSDRARPGGAREWQRAAGSSRPSLK